MNNKDIVPILKSSYLTNKKASEKLNKHGYTLDKELSNKNQKVFTDENGNPNISFRGSKTIKDWVVSDLAILTGNQQYDPRFKNSVKLTKEVKKKYENKPINITGHSLGGSISDYVNNNVKLPQGSKITTYDKGVGIGDLFKTVKSNQTDIRTPSDIVSLGSITQRHPTNNLKTLNKSIFLNPLQAHDINNLKI